MTLPTDQLRREHEKILVALRLLEVIASSDLKLPERHEQCEQLVEFIRIYADELHHGKEEHLLFPAMERQGMPRELGPIACMLHEHEEGRRLVDELETGIAALKDGKGSWAFTHSAAAYVALLRDHIEKENQVLFPMAEDILSPADKAELLESFGTVEEHDIGVETRERLERVIDDLAADLLDQVSRAS